MPSALSGSTLKEAISTFDYFLGNARLKQRYLDNGTDARGLCVVSVNFRLRPIVSAVKVAAVA